MVLTATACNGGASVDVEPAAGEADALIAGGGSTTDVNGPGTLGSVATIASFDVYTGQLPESIAIDRSGNIYVSMSPIGEIWKLDSSGAFVGVAATFPTGAGPFGMTGLRFGAAGDLYAANASGNPSAHGVWKVDPKGGKARISGTNAIAAPNDVAISPDGILYITDSATGAVWRALPGGAAEMWVQSEVLEGTGAFGVGFPIGANGIVLMQGRKMPSSRRSGDASTSGLVIANTEKGQVVYIPVLPDGTAGQPAVLISDPTSLFGLDGITVDVRGTIYGAVNAGNRVVRISSDGSDVTEIISGEPLDFPAAVAFGTGPDRHKVFVVNFSVIHFMHDPPTLDAASPAVIAVQVGAPGASHR